ncbi:SusC/RagA family TonB-linked outer membrane protein [Carboxylicivirga marina]|uniref:SusC/RagA family TonB-linked outer membrane protein n=1 Tax=Carboxylicivirga marina TaxID=2800988 RepID=UPI0025944C18|nr:SusC/RagA family TonB-linked outer membrane protein [uncultured Carboxylicivirga sp.]
MNFTGKWKSFFSERTRNLLKAGVLTCLIMILGSNDVVASSRLKEQKVNLNFKDVTLHELLIAIEEQSNMVFVYNEALVDVSQLVSVNVSNESVENVLNEVLEDADFKVYDNQVVIVADEPETVANTQEDKVQITGTVVDQFGMGIPGVNVSVKGTTTGTITNLDGQFTFEAPANGVIVYSFIGFATQEITIASGVSYNVTMQEDVMNVDEVVVTALGIKREKKALGYSAVDVGEEAFENMKDANPMGALSGRMAGVQINTSSQGAGGSSSVIIRGAAVLSGSNEPLYVVDGVPISNTQFSNADDSDNGGIDSGNGLSGIAADDIENISVLKGPAATALYGSRAINGVVLVTTKTGKGDKGTSVDFNSNMTFDRARIYSNWQEVYGQGINGQAPQSIDAGRDQTSMWGAKYNDVASYVNYRGDQRDYVFHDNERDFFDTGMTWTNSVAVNHNTEVANLRLSYSNTTNNGLVPGTSYDRNTFNVSGGTKAFNDRLEINAKIAYTDEDSQNAMMGATPFNPTSQLLGVPNNVSLDDLKDYKDSVTGMPVGLGVNGNSNIYWTTNEIKHNYRKKRVMSLVNAKLHITDHLNAQVRAGSDMTFFANESIYPIGTPYYEGGRANMMKADEVESNYDFILNYDRNFNDKFGITVNAGASRMDREYESLAIFSDSFSDPGLQRPGFGSNNTQQIGYSRKRINSVYSTAQLRYASMLYVDLSARNDWSSTLPSNNNSYFYPSVSTSFIVSEVVDLPQWMTFAKVRASVAQVGSDTDPYQLALQYKLDDNAHPGWGGNIVVGGTDGDVVPNAALKPSIMTSYEVGADLKFLNNRLGLDVTYYNSTAEDQIMPIDISNTSGYNRAIVNSGSIQNKGWEVVLYATPYRSANFSWNTSFNFSYNINEVKELADGVTQLNLMSGAGVNVIAAVGEEYGTIMGRTMVRDDEGKIVLSDNGLPQATNDYSALGCAYHPVMLGWSNTFNYKSFTLNLLLDSKFGGEVYSATEASAYSLGKHEATIGREDYVAGQEWFPAELEGQGTTARPEDYYGALASIDDMFVYDASYVSLRELSVAYRLPGHLFKDSKYFKSASIGIFGKNLGYLYRSTDNIDPQSTFSISNGGQGIEYGNMALPASFGFNLNLKF